MFLMKFVWRIKEQKKELTEDRMVYSLTKEHELAVHYFDIDVKNGVILSEYEDNLWTLDDGLLKNPITLQLGLKPHVYKMSPIARAGILPPFEIIQQNVKDYYIFTLHSFSLKTGRANIQKLIKCIENDHYFQSANASTYDKYYYDFLTTLEGVPKEYIDEVLKRIRGTGGTDDSVRNLGKIENYMILVDFMDKLFEEAGDRERAFLFPLYLEIHKGLIIPIRPEEMAATPYNCIQTDPVTGHKYVVVSRTTKKGNPVTSGGLAYQTHRREADYMEFSFRIPEDFAQKYEEFRKLREPYSKDGLLYTVEIMRDNHPFGKRMAYSGRFTNRNLDQMLAYVYSKMSSWRLVSEAELKARRAQNEDLESDLEEGELLRVTMSHFRHIAAIKLKMGGASPSALRYMMWHKTEAMDNHYTDHVNEILKWEVIKQYEKVIDNEKKYMYLENKNGRAKLYDYLKDPFVKVKGGRCYSPRYVPGRNDYTDCAKHICLRHDDMESRRFIDHVGCKYFVSDKDIDAVIVDESEYIRKDLIMFTKLFKQQGIHIDDIRDMMIKLEKEKMRIMGMRVCRVAEDQEK